jgi:hypothetical protein
LFNGSWPGVLMDFIDPVIMQNTFDMVVSSWNWASTWGWKNLNDF